MNKNKIIKKVGNVTLGLQYEDILHGQKGVAVCHATHITGCNRIAIEWLDKKSGEVMEMWVDETRLIDSSGDLVVDPEFAEPGAGNDPPKRGIK